MSFIVVVHMMLGGDFPFMTMWITNVMVVAMEMWTWTTCACTLLALRRLVTWTSPPWGWWRGRTVDQQSLNLLHPCILLLLLCGKLVVDVVVHAAVVVEDQRWNVLPIHHKIRANMSGEREERIPNVPWPKLKVDQWSLQCGQGNSTIGTNSCWFLTPTQLRLMVELGEDSGTKI